MTSDELLKQGGLFKIRRNLTDAFDPEDEEQKDIIKLMTQENGDSHYIVIRELSSGEALDVQHAGENEVSTVLIKKLADAIVEHSFRNDKGNVTPNGDVSKIIQMSTSLLMWVLKEWQDASPLAKKTAKGSAGLPVS
jgi:hypothetical protein